MATTTIAKVEAHSGIFGNEEADRLANEGAAGQTSDEPQLAVQTEWTLGGAKINALSYSTAYAWLRKSFAKGKRSREDENVERIQEALADNFNQQVSVNDIWLGLRSPYIRREIADFLWTAIHGRSPCGPMFSKWGEDWEELQWCECGALETMEHILTQCDDAIWRKHLWDEMTDLLRSSKIIPPVLCRRPLFEEIIGAGSVNLGNGPSTRLWATIISETAFMVWKLRNRRRFDGTRISTAMAIGLWRGSLEKRARSDLAAGRLKGPASAPQVKRRGEAETAWKAVLSVKGRAIDWKYTDYG
ncbi:hypothetical protein FRC01_001159 [Tulasnella sp. 417]|nr:hypothetical protein FRC01_001159 [Tulasnella sp. 417]